MNLSQTDRQVLVPLLEQLCAAVEDLLLTGLTTVSESTRQVLTITFQETSRLGLLRLGSTLRFANEELGRFTRGESEFSRKRFSFFLNRAWLLSHGLARAIRDNDDKEFDRLSYSPKPSPVAQLKLAVMGVLKKASAGVCSFEFRMRLIEKSANLERGQKVVWSSLFPLKPGADLPIDAYLHLPQKQKFVAYDFLSGSVVNVKDAAIAMDQSGTGRLILTEKSVLNFSEKFNDWQSFLTWDSMAALKRIESHKVSPLDLEVEMQEELVLNDWAISTATEHDESQLAFPILASRTAFHAIVSKNEDGKELKKSLDKRVDSTEPNEALFGLLHFEKCKLILQALTIFTDKGPHYLMISEEKIDRQKLVRALSFT